MPKRLTPIPREQIDTTNTDKAYWEEVLRREGLGMNRGLHPNVYVGSTKNLDDIVDGAQVKIKGHYGTVISPQSEPTADN